MIIPDEDEHVRKRALLNVSLQNEPRTPSLINRGSGRSELDLRIPNYPVTDNNLDAPPSYEATLLLRSDNSSLRARRRFVRTLVVAILICVLAWTLGVGIFRGIQVRTTVLCFESARSLSLFLSYLG
jgi:hypothetical protein